MEKNMIKLVQPQITDLKYRKKLLKDKKTMAFNKINGGTVDFNEKIWKSPRIRLSGTTSDRKIFANKAQNALRRSVFLSNILCLGRFGIRSSE